MEKHVAVVIRHIPFNSERNSEALRMSVGLTTGDNRVSVVFLEDGVLTLRLQPAVIAADDVGKHLQACQMLGVRLVADEEALRRHAVGQPAAEVDRPLAVAAGVEPVPFSELCRLLAAADVVIPF